MKGRITYLRSVLVSLLIFSVACSPKSHLQTYSYLVDDIEMEAATSTPAKTPSRPTSPPSRPAKPSKHSPSQKAVKVALSYIGTPYQYGGLSKKGIDCSGLVYTSYQAAGVNLPRVSSQQVRAGKNITAKELRSGDLIFFDSRNRKGNQINHVGLVIEVKKARISFIHASSSRGVRIDHLEDPYWKVRFRKAVALESDMP